MLISLAGFENGVFDGYEGEDIDLQIETSGFSYGNIPLRVSLLSYSQFVMAGNNLEDHFDPNTIPPFSADGKDTLLKLNDPVLYGASAFVH